MKKSQIGKNTKKGQGWRENKDSTGKAPNHSQARKYGYSGHTRKTANRSRSPQSPKITPKRSLDIYKMGKNKYVLSNRAGKSVKFSEKELIKTFGEDGAKAINDSMNDNHTVLESIPKEAVDTSIKAMKEADGDTIDTLAHGVGKGVLFLIPGGKVAEAIVKARTGKDPINTLIQESPRHTVKRKDLTKAEIAKRVAVGVATGGASGLYYAEKDKKTKV